jgi:hypothetical protein
LDQILRQDACPVPPGEAGPVVLAGIRAARAAYVCDGRPVQHEG